MIEERLGAILRRRRLERGLTQTRLSVIAGIVQSHVSALESASKPPTIQTLERICAALDVSVSEVISEAEAMTKVPSSPAVR